MGGHCTETHPSQYIQPNSVTVKEQRNCGNVVFKLYLFHKQKFNQKKVNYLTKTQSQALKYQKTLDRGKDTKTVSGRSPRPLLPLAFSYLLFYKCLHP